MQTPSFTPLDPQDSELIEAAGEVIRRNFDPDRLEYMPDVQVILEIDGQRVKLKARDLLPHQYQGFAER